MSNDDFSKRIIIFMVVFSFLAPAQAFFRHLCFNPLGFGRIDPVVFPGQLSTHLHHLHGSGNLGINSIDADTLLASNCTSCSITLDKSGYWAPAMYFQHENGTFELLSTAGSLTIYYKTEKRADFLDRNYTAFPKNFRMVAGDPNKRSWVGPWPIIEQSFWTDKDTTQEALASKAIGFNCMNYQITGEATFAFGYIRDKAYTDVHCLDGVRAEIMFPSCWDGVNLDSPDHKSHVVYPRLLQDGACPITHPVYLPILFFETIWNTQQFAGVPGQYVMSNGDPTGYGYHADFLAAWEDGVFERAMKHPDCTDQDLLNRHSDGIQEHCPVFDGYIQSQEQAAQCKFVPPPYLIHEKFFGPLTSLPGNVPVSGARHDPGTTSEDSAVPVAQGNSSYVIDHPASSSVSIASSPISIMINSTSQVVTATPSVSLSSTSQAYANVSSVVTPAVSETTTPVASPLTATTAVTTTVFDENSETVVVEIIEVVYLAAEAATSDVPAAASLPGVRRRHVHGKKHYKGI